MFRILLFIATLGTMLQVQAQEVVKSPVAPSSIQKAHLSHAVPVTKRAAVDGDYRPVYNGKTDATPIVSNPSQQSVGTLIGTTYYDLQSNSGMCRRITLDDSGNIHATWTRGGEDFPNFADRGTGYNTNASGDWGPDPSGPLEEQRAGWPNVGITEDGRVFSVTHTVSSSSDQYNGLNFAYKDGDSEWVNALIPDDPFAVWARAAVDGNNIHVITSRSEGDASGIPGGLNYFRSFDGGDNWDGPYDVPGLSDLMGDVSADSYFIDAKDGVVSFILGTAGNQLVMYKSTDDGTTWDYSFVQSTSNPFPNGDDINHYMEPVVISSGGVSCIIDDNGIVHVVFNRYYQFRTINNDEPGIFFYPNSSCLMYWNEGLGNGGARVIGETVRQDYDQDGSTNLVGDGYEYRSYGGGIVGHPSLGLDADGTLYCAFSSTIDGAVDAAAAAEGGLPRFFRDVYMVKTSNAGQSWVGPYNVTNDSESEDAYPSIARTVDGNIHLIYQNDALSGTALQAALTDGTVIGHSTYVQNSIYYVSIPVDEIETPSPLVNTPPVLIADNTFYTAYLEGCDPNNALGNLYPTSHALDYPDGLAPVSFIGSAVDNIDVPATEAYELIIQAVDSDGNIDSLSYSTTVSVNENAEAPLVLLRPYDIFDDVGYVGLPQPYDLSDWATVPGTFLNFFVTDLFDTTYVLQGEEYVDFGADAVLIDAEGNATATGWFYGCPPSVTTDNPVDTETPGEYTVTYTATSHAGVVSEAATRTVIVIGSDLEAPSITLFDEFGNVVTSGSTAVVDFQLGAFWEDPGFFAFDNIDGVVEENVEVSITDSEGNTIDAISLETTGSYTITYTVTDAAGNPAEVTRIITIADTTPPEIDFVGGAVDIIGCGEDFELEFTVTDNVDGDITDEATIIYSIEYENETYYGSELCSTYGGTYFIEIQVADASGNAGVIVDDLPPDGLGARVLVSPTGPCGDALCESYSTIIGIEETLSAEAINIYPVPSNGELNVVAQDLSGDMKVMIYNAAGQLVKMVDTNAKQHVKVDLNDQATGMYMVRVVTEEGALTKKVMVNN